MDRVFIVHPQVALQIADHKTRSNFFEPEFKAKCKFVIGIIYGYVDERKTELCSTTEIIVNPVAGGYEVDNKAYHFINNHHMVNYVGEIELGWYNISPMNDKEIAAVNAAMEKIFKVQIRITYDEKKKYTLNLFAPNEKEWIPVFYRYQSELAEHAAIMEVQSQGDAKKQISFTADAYNAFDQQLQVIQEFLLKTKEGKIPFNPDLVRRCNDIGLWFIHSRRNIENEVNIEEGQLALLCGLLAEAMIKIEPTLEKKPPKRMPSRQSSSKW
jgi:hypothetical protein